MADASSDEVLLVSLLQKCSQAIEEAGRKRKELAQLELEHAEHQRKYITLQDELQTWRSKCEELMKKVQPAGLGNDALIKLKEVEGGLERARTEYQRVKDQLQAANEQALSLTAERDNLILEKQSITEHRDELANELGIMQTDLTRSRSEITDLHSKIEKLSISSNSQPQPPQEAFDSRNRDVEDSLKAKVGALEKEVEELRSLSRVKESEHQESRRELQETLTHLHKIEETNKTLVLAIKSVKHIAREIIGPVIHSTAPATGPPHDDDTVFSTPKKHGSVPEVKTIDHYTPRTVPIATDMKISPDPSDRSTREGSKSLYPRKHSSVSEVIDHHEPRRIPIATDVKTSPDAKAIRTSPEGSKSLHRRTIKIADDETAFRKGSVSNAIAGGSGQSFQELRHSPLPIFRQQALADFPIIIPDINLSEDLAHFDRNFLKSAIGGSIQSLIVRVSHSQTDFAKMKNISTYLCPGLDHNPWCPSTPGQHGYIFVGLGGEKNTFILPQDQHIFVGIKPKTRDRRKYIYLGYYRALRVDPLTVEEWKALPISVRTTYSRTTQEKADKQRTAAQVQVSYDRGELRVPCVRLECLEFDDSFYAVLLSKKADNDSSPGSSTLAKRAREDGEQGGNGYPKRRSSRKSV